MELHNDDQLWQVAKKRARFKKHLTTYLIMSAFFWAIWWVTQGRSDGIHNWAGAWPIWAMLGWGLGIAFQYFDAYGTADKQTAVEQEYEKLKRQQQSL